MQVTVIGQYRCACSWVLGLVPETGNLACPNPACESAGRVFLAPTLELSEPIPEQSATPAS